jgi:hypothetical protein
MEKLAGGTKTSSFSSTSTIIMHIPSSFCLQEKKTNTKSNQRKRKERLGVLFYFIFTLKQERRLSSSNGLLFLSSLSRETD